MKSEAVPSWSGKGYYVQAKQTTNTTNFCRYASALTCPTGIAEGRRTWNERRIVPNRLDQLLAISLNHSLTLSYYYLLKYGCLYTDIDDHSPLMLSESCWMQRCEI
jgi:hypothetical protein